MSAPEPIDALAIACRLAGSLDAAGQEYALGGAIALGFSGVPRGTLDVDVTLFMPPDRPAECVWLLQDLGCEVDSVAAIQSFREHGFARLRYESIALDVFLPAIPFYAAARRRRRHVPVGQQSIWVWDAETLAVFKMMFFRLKDLADIEQLLLVAGAAFDRPWVREQIVQLYGERDPRVARWDELAGG
jgi:hypothetical protein